MHNSIKDKVLQATDIIEVVSEHVSLTRRGKEFIGLCPFHPDRKPSLNVSPAKQIFKCFACGAGGDVIKFVQLRERLEFQAALAFLAQRAGIDVHSTPAEARDERRIEQMRKTIEWARDHFQRNLHDTPAGQAARDYARRRGLTPETISRHGLGLAVDSWDDLLHAGRRAGVSMELLQSAGLTATNEAGRTYDRFRNRLIFPINDGFGRCVAFGGRTLGDDPAKYLNSPETGLFSKSRVLYGLDLAKRAIADAGCAVVVEGYLDAVLLHQFGFTHAVATLGTALTDAHVKALRRISERVILCFDGDQAGVRAADRAVEVAVLGGTEVRVAVLEGGQDPADCLLAAGRDGFSRVLDLAVDALQFKWSQMVTAFGSGGAGAQRTAVEALIEFIARLTTTRGLSALDHGLLVRRLAELLALPPRSVHDLLASARRRLQPAGRSTAAALEALPEYELAIRGLPPGLVVGMEECFGLLLSDAACAELVDDVFAAAVEQCDVWRRLYAVVQNLLDEQGSYKRADVIGRCGEADVCELVSRACGRVAGLVATQELFVSARDRVRLESDALRMAASRQALAGSATKADAGDRTFCELLSTARGRHFALAAENCWNTRPTS
jgi:DNA primase